MNPISQILWEAAEDVERRGVTRSPDPDRGEVCAVTALYDRGWQRFSATCDTLRLASGTRTTIDDWNDAQPSRAVVAAAMRDAAFLASWAGPHLLGGSK